MKGTKTKRTGILLMAFFLIVLVVGLVVFGIYQYKNRYQSFAKEGYVLSTQNSEYHAGKLEKYYFTGGTKYQKKYENKVTFKTTDQKSVHVDDTTFIHYQDGAISTLKKGVIMDLHSVTNEILPYYNIFEGTVLEKVNQSYTVNHLGKQLKFDDFVVKISDTKYLVVANSMHVQSSSHHTSEISGYVEIQFGKGNIVRIDNQEVSYQTIAEEAKIRIGEHIELKFSDKGIYYDGKRIVTLDQMVIDSDDNIEISPLETSPSPSGSASPSPSPTPTGTGDNQNQQGGGTINGGTGNEEEIDQTENEILPVFTISDFITTSNKVQTNIKIIDEDGLLSSDVLVKIQEATSGKTVYQKEITSGVYDFEILVENLVPETNYILTLRANYLNKDVTYTRDFIQKNFYTEAIGLTFEKNYFTKNELSFRVLKQDTTEVRGVDLSLFDSDGTTLIKKVTLNLEELNFEREENIVTFDELKANTQYIVKMDQFLYDGAILSEQFEVTKKVKTLKEKPTMGETSFTIDKKNGQFVINLNNVVDPNHGISSYCYEVYDARTLTEENIQPISVFEKNRLGSIELKVDGVNLIRGIPYVFKVITSFYDNEKTIEYESDYSGVMKMDGVEFPTLHFEEQLVTFERIEGNIQITDLGNTIRLDTGEPMLIVYTDSTGTSKSFTTSGNLVIPFSENNLRSNETYTISVYATVDLQDGNAAIDQCYLGSVIVKTKEPLPLKNAYQIDANKVTSAFTVISQLGTDPGVDNELEATTLSGVTFKLYAGKNTTGTLIKTVQKVDRDLRPYESDLKKEYYDQQFVITPEFFGSKNEDLDEEYYTIEINSAYDYTTYKNNLPIQNNIITVKANGYIPTPPVDKEKAIEVNMIRNKDGGDHYREDLLPETVIGYRIRANYDNSRKYAKAIEYHLFDKNTNTELTSYLTKVEIKEDGIIDYVEFYLRDGTPFSEKDTEFARGNEYYFTYKAHLDLNGDGVAETVYPQILDEQMQLKSSTLAPAKQPAEIQMYPSVSNANTMTWKYKVKDIDHTLVESKFISSINGGEIGKLPVTIDPNNYQSVTFNRLRVGFLGIDVLEALSKKDEAITKRKIVYQYFDGIPNMKALSFHAELEVNRIILTLLDSDANKAYIDRIAGLKAVFEAEGDSVELDHLVLDGDSVVIDLADLSKLKGKNITISLYAYYDSGVTGFDLGNSKIALQLMKDATGGGTYFTLNSNLNFRSDPSANGSIYITKFALPTLSLNNLPYQREVELTVVNDEMGIVYNYEHLLQKKLEMKELQNDGNSDLKFDMIVPGVSLLEGTNSTISPELKKATVKIKMFGVGASEIQEDKVYIEVYETDETAVTSKKVQEIIKTRTELENSFEIKDLKPDTHYYLRLYAYINTGSEYKKQQLYDIDFQSATKLYYFKTLSNIGAKNIVLNYVANTYQEKYIQVSYQVDRTIGYDRVAYTLYTYETNEAGEKIEVPVNIEITDDFIFKKNMLKNIPCPPGSNVEFGKEYHIKIQPYTTIRIEDGTKEVALDQEVSNPFLLDYLQSPFIGVRTTITDNSGIDFRVSVSDIHKVIVDGKFSVKFINAFGDDITPEEYAGKQYSIYTLNQMFRIESLLENTEYRMIVTTYNDMKNDIVSTVKKSEVFSVTTPDDLGVDLGSVYSTMNLSTHSKIDLTFYNSYKLNYITEIRYSIYSLNGYAQDNLIEFTPIQMTSPDGIYYLFTLPEMLPSEGLYYIQIQFLNDGKILRERTIEHNYTG